MHPELKNSVEALKSLQGNPLRRIKTPVSVVGTRASTPSQEEAAYSLGYTLAQIGLTVLCGGKGGVMEATCRGVAKGGGISVGLLPDEDAESANPFVDIPLATGIGVARNALIARAGICMIAIGGGHGTLSEIAFALQFKKRVFCLEGAPVVHGALQCMDVEDTVHHVAETIVELHMRMR